MSWSFIAAAVGCAIGVVMGLAMLIRPRQSHLSIGLASSPEKSGGVGESRAFGGMLLGLHGCGLAAILSFEANAARVLLAPIAIGWTLALAARGLSMIVDREGMALNARLIGLDALMTVLIAAALLA